MHSTSAIALNDFLMQDKPFTADERIALLSRSNVDLMEAHAVSTEKFPETNLAFLMQLFEVVGMLSFRIVDMDEFYANMAVLARNV